MSGFGYLSIIEWPARADEERLADVLAACTGLDRPTALLRARKEPPMILRRMAAHDAVQAADALHRHGVTAFAATQEAMAAVPDSLRAKSLLPAIGAPRPMYTVEAWRGEGRTLLAEQIFLIVRAQLRTKETRTRRESGPSGGFALGYMVGGWAGAAAAATMAQEGSTRHTTVRTHDLIDLYLLDGSRIRIDGDKFNFDVLGDQRGSSDRENADRLALRLASEAPRALVDTNFRTFTCPSECLKSFFAATSAGSLMRKSEAPAFEFYSVWCCLMYRSLLPGA